VTVIADLNDIFTNSNSAIFDASSFGNIANFEWYKVAIFYIAVMFTVMYLTTLVWGYFKDKKDSLKVIPIS
jgi:hypothetical protein